MNQIVLIISISCFAVLFAEASGIVQLIKYHLNISRLSPMDCPLCLAWWIALVFFILHKQFLEAPLFASAASLLAVFISKELKK